MLKEKTIEQLLNDLSSEAPTLGGGTVSGLAGAFSAALVSMVCHLTIGKKGYRQFEDELSKILEKSIKLQQEFQLLAEKDAEVFEEVMSAFSLPHTTEEDQEERKSKIEQATKKAALIPMDIIKRCEKLSHLCLSVALKGNENSVNDAGVAAIMVTSAAESASMNVLINLATIADEDFKGKVKTEQEMVLKGIKKLKEETLQVVESKI